MMKCGCDLILEGNFVPGGIKKTDEAGEMQSLIHRYGYDVLNVALTGDIRVLYQRFLEREETHERGEVNKIDGGLSLEAFERNCRNLDAFSLHGTRLEIDTTDFAKVDFERCFQTVEDFWKNA